MRKIEWAYEYAGSPDLERPNDVLDKEINSLGTDADAFGIAIARPDAGATEDDDTWFEHMARFLISHDPSILKRMVKGPGQHTDEPTSSKSR